MKQKAPKPNLCYINNMLYYSIMRKMQQQVSAAGNQEQPPQPPQPQPPQPPQQA